MNLFCESIGPVAAESPAFFLFQPKLGIIAASDAPRCAY